MMMAMGMMMNCTSVIMQKSMDDQAKTAFPGNRGSIHFPAAPRRIITHAAR
jgi:hypothetical protein